MLGKIGVIAKYCLNSSLTPIYMLAAVMIIPLLHIAQKSDRSWRRI